MTSAGRRFTWALGISAALHLFLLGAHVRLPQPAPPPALTVKLEALPRLPSRSAAPHHAPPKPHPKFRPAPRPKPAAETVAAAPAPPPPETPAEADASATTPSSEQPPATPALPPPKPLTPLPKQITIAYVLYKGDQKLNVGEMTHTWRVADGQYTLTSIARATGLFSLFVRGTLIQVSRGELTPEGLQPEEFWIQRGQSGDRTESASFDWANRLLRYGRADDRHATPLAPGTQDVLSVLYQLTLTAPHTGTIDLAVTNGRKFDHYLYQVVGQEPLDTPLGTLRTEHLSKVRAAGEDGLDVWLAPDYQYLPVRLRIVDKNGDSAEQMATAIEAQ